MSSMIRFKLALASAALVLSPLSQAAVFGQVQPDQSNIAFTFEQMGVKMDGQFRQFEAQLQFDPEQPSEGSAKFQVELGSVTLGSPEFDQEVVGKDWFNVKSFPKAEFVSTGIKAVADNRYEVSGVLTIKGQSQTVTVPANFKTEGNKGVFEGEFTIERGQFNIGEGSWAKFDIVANDVFIKFRITALAE